MKYIARKDEILEILGRYHYVTVEFLAEALYVSASSIRRDLAAMEAQGLVKRKHGGVSEVQTSNALTPYSMRMHENSTKKRAICKKAAELVEDGDVVFIDGSTTCLYLPELLEKKRELTVLTNSLRLATMFQTENVKVYVTGGSVRLSDEYVTSGPMAEETCRGMHTDIMFFSARAVDENGNITDLNEPETSVRRVALQNTEKAVFLCDDSKIGKKSVFYVCSAQQLFCMVTNQEPGIFLENVEVLW